MIAHVPNVFFFSAASHGSLAHESRRLSRFLWGNAGISIFQELRARFVLLKSEVIKIKIFAHAYTHTTKKRRGSLYYNYKMHPHTRDTLSNPPEAETIANYEDSTSLGGRSSSLRGSHVPRFPPPARLHAGTEHAR